MLALSLEALFEVCRSDETRAIRVKVVESKQKVAVLQSLALVNSCRQKLRVVDLAVMTQID